MARPGCWPNISGSTRCARLPKSGARNRHRRILPPKLDSLLRKLERNSGRTEETTPQISVDTQGSNLALPARPSLCVTAA